MHMTTTHNLQRVREALDGGPVMAIDRDEFPYCAECGESGSAAFLTDISNHLPMCAYVKRQKALTLLDSVIEGMKWRPISEAPKDGTHILVNDTNRKQVHIAYWEPQKYHRTPRPYWHRIKASSDKQYDRLFQPTHFMELPQPPESEAASAEVRG